MMKSPTTYQRSQNRRKFFYDVFEKLIGPQIQKEQGNNNLTTYLQVIEFTITYARYNIKYS